MAIKRVALRCVNSSDLSAEEQKTFADDVQDRIEDTGVDLGGYFQACGGINWIELEGDENAVNTVIKKHVGDDRVKKYKELENVNPSSTTVGAWRSHTQPDIHDEIT